MSSANPPPYSAMTMPESPHNVSLSGGLSTLTVVHSGMLYKRGGSRRSYVMRAAPSLLDTWREKYCELLSNGTFRYRVHNERHNEKHQTSQPINPKHGSDSISTAVAEHSPSSPLQKQQEHENYRELEGGHTHHDAAVGQTETVSAVPQRTLVSSSSTSSSSNSDAGGGDDSGLVEPLFPGGAMELSRDEQIRLAPQLPKNVAISCVFSLRLRGARSRIMYLCANSADDAHTWRKLANDVSINALAAISPKASSDLHHMLDAWDRAPKTTDGCVRDETLPSVTKTVNARIPADDLRLALLQSSRQHPDRVSFQEFVIIMRDLSLNPAWKSLFTTAGGVHGKSDLSAAQLATLLQIDNDSAAALFQQHRLEQCGPLVMQELLCAPHNSAIDPALIALRKEDMMRPLSEYYISSSHNTYLLGDQLHSYSSTTMYKVVLEAGARCVEVDLWDGDKEPNVKHGHTLTSEISFKSVLETVKQYAFVSSQYPVILSLENHMTEHMQKIASRDIKDILGDTLHVLDSSADSSLPSPEDLKGKILVKAKKGKVVQTENAQPVAYSDDDEDEEDVAEEQAELAIQTEPNTNGKNNGNDSSKFRSLFTRARDKIKKAVSSSDSNGKRKDVTKSTAKVVSVVPELSDLVSFGGGNRQKILDSWKVDKPHPEGQKASEIVSLSETKIESVYENQNAGMLRDYNKRNLTRVYPKGSRVDSSNYNPLLAWNSGCQLVALNWQTADVPMWLHHGRFIVNGGSGYVPRVMSNLSSEIKGHGIVELNVLCGRLLPKPASKLRSRDVSDPYVEVCLATCGDDGLPKTASARTPVVKANGWSPCWQHVIKLEVSNAEKDLLLLCVWDEDTASKDDLIGFCCAPAYTLRTGVRAFNLLSPDGTPLRVPGTQQLPTILCDIVWNEMSSTP